MKQQQPWPNDDALVTIQSLLVGKLTSFKFGSEGDPQENFRKFATTNITDLDQFETGNASHLMEVNVQVNAVTELIESMGAELGKQAPLPNVPPRTLVAVTLIQAAAQMVNSALVMHMRASKWYTKSTLILLRSAIEQVAVCGFIALGSGCEATRWLEGHKLEDEKARKNAKILAAECFHRVRPFISNRYPQAGDPYNVYRWLCNYTHLNSAALASDTTHEDAYAAMAYVAWFCAALAEHVLGVPGVARWPQVWPAKLPWAP